VLIGNHADPARVPDLFYGSRQGDRFLQQYFSLPMKFSRDQASLFRFPPVRPARITPVFGQPFRHLTDTRTAILTKHHQFAAATACSAKSIIFQYIIAASALGSSSLPLVLIVAPDLLRTY